MFGPGYNYPQAILYMWITVFLYNVYIAVFYTGFLSAQIDLEPSQSGVQNHNNLYLH